DKDHYSSFIGQLLYMGYQNNGEYLKKERITLREALLNYESEIYDFSIKEINEPLTKLLSFNLAADESDFENYLVKDEFKKLLEFVAYFSSEENQLKYDENLQVVADAWGQFFAGRNNNDVYIKLLNIAFFDDNGGMLDLYEDGAAETVRRKNLIEKFVFRMFGNIPEQANPLYVYLTEDNLSRLKKIIKNASLKDEEVHSQVFYDGLTKILDSERDINARIEIVKWAIDDDDFLNNTHENMVVNIFKNIQDQEDKKAIYNFLTYKDGVKLTGEKTYEYFSKITDEGMLCGSGGQTQLVEYYVSRIQEGIGSVEDRIGIVKKVLAQGDDWSMLWFANNTEDLVSSLFNNLSRGDAEYVIGALKGEDGDYKLFRQVWQALQSVNVPVWFDRD